MPTRSPAGSFCRIVAATGCPVRGKWVGSPARRGLCGESAILGGLVSGRSDGLLRRCAKRPDYREKGTLLGVSAVALRNGQTIDRQAHPDRELVPKLLGLLPA